MFDCYCMTLNNSNPYLTVAGHYKYGQQSLPHYLFEMKNLSDTVSYVHQMIYGAFVGRRADGHHNAVSSDSDMFLEQIYNADAKETSDFDDITFNTTART